MQPAYTFKLPYPLAPDETMLAPGTYPVFELWQEWAHVRTPNGERWVNPNFTLPANMKEDQVDVTLERRAYVYKYPFFQSDILGAISPQTVTADGYGSGWYHIDSWVGPGWIYVLEQRFDVFDPGDGSFPWKGLRTGKRLRHNKTARDGGKQRAAIISYAEAGALKIVLDASISACLF